jgi:hypothetical protein
MLQRQRRACVVRAAAQPDDASPVNAVQHFARSAERVLSRYDFLSAGMGAMMVTGFCVARGQDIGTALWITAAATVGEPPPLAVSAPSLPRPCSIPALLLPTAFYTSALRTRMLATHEPHSLPAAVAILVNDVLPEEH